jgi:hypothetical protein
MTVFGVTRGARSNHVERAGMCHAGGNHFSKENGLLLLKKLNFGSGENVSRRPLELLPGRSQRLMVFNWEFVACSGEALR